MTQPAVITLSVDADGAGAGAAADENFSNFDRFSNRSVYHAPGHSTVLRDTLTLYRTLPKPTSIFYGVQKSAAKFSLDVEVDTPSGVTTRSPIIYELSASIPVGASATDILHVEERVKALIYNRDLMIRLFTNGEI